MPLYDEQVARMKELMNIGNINEDKKNDFNTNIVEYHALGADGKTYGIVREGTKYYIKVAPKKDTDIVAEDYDYIGGYCNKKRYEYDSYSNASKNLDLKLMSIKESLCSKDAVCESYDPYKKMDIIIEETDAMKSEINRQKEIMRNVSLLMNEESAIGFSNTGVPEAPKTAKKSDTQNAPYTEKAKADMKDNVKSSNDHTKKAPFDEDGEVDDSDMQSDKAPKGSCKSCDKNAPHTEKAKYVPENSVANQKPKGGKSVKVNESKKHVLRMTEEQVLAWNDNKDYIDTSTETKIGDGDPFNNTVACDCNQIKDEKIDEDVAMWAQGDNINNPTPGNGEIGDGDPFNNNVSEDSEISDSSNYAGFDDDNFDNEWESWLNDGANPDEVNQDDYQYNDNDIDVMNNDDENYATDFNGNPVEYNDEFEFESKHKKSANIKEDKLDVFGKTPGYRKKPMTLPPNTEVAPNGAKDWNDKSVEGEEPFGQKIGSSAPYTELVQQITNAIVTAITKNVNLKKKA